MEKQKSIKFSTVFTYGAGGMFVNTFYLMLVAYFLMYFLTNVLGLSTLLAATIYSITQWAKVLTMLLGGVVIDSTNLKWGKYRSWCTIGSLLLLVSLPLMYTNFHLSTTLTCIIFVVLFVIQTFAYNTMWVAQRSLVGPLSKSSSDSVALNSASQAGSSLGSVIYGLVGASILALMGSSYALTGVLYAGLIVIGNIGIAAISKKYDLPAAEADAENKPKAEKITLGQMFKGLKGPMIPYFFAMIFGTAQSGFFFALLVYFTQYVLKNPTITYTSVTLAGISGFLGAMCVRPICKIMSKKMCYIFSTACCAVTYALMIFFGKTTVGFLILYAIVYFFAAFSGVLLPSFANDIADYNEMNGEKAARGFIQSIAGVTIRIGSLVSTMVASFGLAATGFQSNTVPSEKVINGITNLIGYGPAIVCAIACVVFVFYKINEKQLDEYRLNKAK